MKKSSSAWDPSIERPNARLKIKPEQQRQSVMLRAKRWRL